jgi:phosphoglycerate dehydrogenase-like enzyme
MAFSVHLLDPPEAQWLQFLETLLDAEIRLTWGESLPGRVDVLVAGRPGAEALAACPGLRALVIPWAGVPPVTRQLMEAYPAVAVYNLHHNAAQTAEMALALLLAASKRLIPADAALRLGNWRPRYQGDASLTLAGKTVLVLGFGEIGQRVGRACHALGMQVLAIRRRPEQPLSLDYPVEIGGAEQMPGFLRRSQVLMITLPGTPATERLIGQAELERLPPGAVLVNIGRGVIVDQAALYQALRSGRLGAAGLDVWYNYPKNEAEWTHTPPAEYPFGELDNVVLSPHRAGGGDDTEPLRMQHLAAVLNALCRGGEPPNRVDVKTGY